MGSLAWVGSAAVVLALSAIGVVGLSGCAPVAVPTPPLSTASTVTPIAPAPSTVGSPVQYPPDSTPGTYQLDSHLPTAISRGQWGVRLEGAGQDAVGLYAILGGVRVHLGESHHFDGLGTITVLAVLQAAPLPSGQVGGPGDQATVSYQPD